MKYRIKKLRKLKGITQVDLVTAANISQSYLSQLENGLRGKAPSMETLAAIANALDVKLTELIDDTRPVAVAGKVGAGAKVPLFDAYEKGDGLYHVAYPAGLPLDDSVVAVEIEGDSMEPVYHDCDLLFYSRDVVGVPSEAIGRTCVCEDSNEFVWVKHLKQGTEPGKFHLISLNPLSDNIMDTTLNWASPIKLHWPKELVEKL